MCQSKLASLSLLQGTWPLLLQIANWIEGQTPSQDSNVQEKRPGFSAITHQQSGTTTPAKTGGCPAGHFHTRL